MRPMPTFLISLFVFLFSILQLFITKASCNEYYFIQETPLFMEEKINLGCVLLESSANGNMIKCASLCSQNSTCPGISFDSSSNCFLHQQCPDLVPKGHNDNSGHRYMVKSETPFPCLHDGVWREEEDRCDCKYGWIGKYCDTMAKSCADLERTGFSGYQFVYLDLRNDTASPMLVRCFVNGGYSYAMVTNNSGDYDYNKTYAEFVQGFGEDTVYGHFIGLEAMFLLIQAGFSEFYLYLKMDVSAKYYGRYTVSMSNSTDGYALNVIRDRSYTLFGEPGMNLTDCFKGLQNVPFSTWDSDNDDAPKDNCAARTGTGWWFNGCDVSCNLLGKWFGSSANTSSEEAMKLASVNLDVLQVPYVEVWWYLRPPL